MTLVTYNGRAPRVRIGDGIVLVRGVPTPVHPLLARSLLGRRDFDVLELDDEGQPTAEPGPRQPKDRKGAVAAEPAPGSDEPSPMPTASGDATAPSIDPDLASPAAPPSPEPTTPSDDVKES